MILEVAFRCGRHPLDLASLLMPANPSGTQRAFAIDCRCFVSESRSTRIKRRHYHMLKVAVGAIVLKAHCLRVLMKCRNVGGDASLSDVTWSLNCNSHAFNFGHVWEWPSRNLSH